MCRNKFVFLVNHCFASKFVEKKKNKKFTSKTVIY